MHPLTTTSRTCFCYGFVPETCRPNQLYSRPSPKKKTLSTLTPEGWKLKCATVKSQYIGDGHHTFNRNPYNRYINPYYWVDDHPLLYGNNGSLDPGTNDCFLGNSGNSNHPNFSDASKFGLVLLLGGSSQLVSGL